MRRVEVSPAALGSVLLHGAVAAALMISWGARDLKVGSVVPVTIVSNAPDASLKPAVQAEETQTATADELVAETPPEPVPPPPAPPTTSAVKPPPEKALKPAPTKPTTKPADKSLDLDALAASLTKPARNTPARPTAAPKGPVRPDTAPVANTSAGSGAAAAAAAQGWFDEINRRWNVNCDVEGGRDVLVRVRFRLGAGGQVVGDPVSEILSAKSPVAQVGAERAVRAIFASTPARGLPHEYYGGEFRLNFIAREACANR
jgi:protein TonB